MRNKKKQFMSLLLATVIGLSAIGTDSFNQERRIVRAAGCGVTEKQDGWESIYFGSYWQNDTNGDGVADQKDEKQPIRWRVLNKNGNYALLLSDQILDAGKFYAGGDSATWASSDVRNWLNTTFYNTAFNTREQTKIVVCSLETKGDEDTWGITTDSTKDKVFLLSYQDVCNTCEYGFDDACGTYSIGSNTRTTTNTAYTAGKAGMYSNTTSADTWWLRNSGMLEEDAYVVLNNGGIAITGNPVNVIAGIRPAIYVNLEDTSLWSAGGRILVTELPEVGDVNGSMWDASGNLPISNQLPDWYTVPGGDVSDTTETEVPSSDSQETPATKVNLAHLTFTKRTEGGQVSQNQSGHDYEWNWSSVVSSYLEETVNGNFQRVEACADGIYIENYSKDFVKKDSKKIDMELPVFGGYFSGSQYNFLVFGQENPAESDSVEVVRVVKYDKNWNYLGACPISAVNTSIPFRAGSLSMTETDGVLYIHTCHQMYKSDDGLNHQANMTFSIEQSTMTAVQKQYSVWNISGGYVSHSFNQFIETDGTSLYRLDHGDAYPRSIVLTKCNKNNVQSCSNINLLDIAGNIGDNYTGVSVGGFDLNGNRMIAVGNSINQSGADRYGQRNLFVSITDTNLSGTSLMWLTDYVAGDGIEIGNPYLVSCNGGYYVMWEEKKDNDILTKIIKIDGSGNIIEGAYSIYARLSDCQPIITSDNKLVWYMTANSSPVFYQLDTSDLSAYVHSEKVDLKDCTVTLSQNSYEYNASGNVYQPIPTVKYGDYTMIPNQDYSVLYSNNYYPGTAKVTITGKGFFTGTKEVSFEIVNPSKSGQPSEANPGVIVNPGKTTTTQTTTSSEDKKSAAPSFQTTAMVKPSTPASVKAKNYKKKALKVTWKKVKNAEYYQVQIAGNKRFTKGKKTSVSYSGSKSFKGLKKKQTYYVRVRAVSYSNGNVYYSKWSTVKKCKIKR